MTDTFTPTRAHLVERFLDLRPQLDRRFAGELDRELRDTLYNVTFRQLGTLRQLQDGPLPMREIARRLGIGESAATATADRLVRQGLVERQGDSSDRRVVRLALSPSGSEVVAAFQQAVTARTRKILSVLSDLQLEQLVGIYETLHEAFDPGDATEAPL
jgi:DNA-binding MarR family transcriptional regulator